MTYEIDKNLVTLQKLTFLLRVCEAVARLDQKASGSPLLDGWRERLLFDEAVAVQWAEGELIHVDELVQLDAGARRQGDLAAIAVEGWGRAGAVVEDDLARAG